MKPLLFLLFFNSLSFSQFLLPPDSLIYINMDNFINEDGESDSFADYLEYLSSNPININDARTEDLLKLPFINFGDALSIIEYRNNNKLFFSINELFNISNIERNTIKSLLPFVTVKRNEVEVPSRFFNYKLRSSFHTELTPSEGILNGIYHNEKHRYNNKIFLSTKKFQLGFNQEKDIGENNFFDHYSGFISAELEKFQSTMILGDFSPSFGKGLLINSQTQFNKNVFGLSGSSSNQIDTKPFFGNNESNYFRGISVISNFFQYKFSFFYSSKFLDSRNDSSGAIQSFLTSGYHRSKTELANKQNSTITSIGLSTQINSIKNFSFSLIYLNYFFNKDISENLPFAKKYNNGYSLFANYHMNKTLIYSEAAYFNNSFAFLIGADTKLTDKLLTGISYRRYSAEYYSLFANSLSEYSGVNNEEGFLLTLKYLSSIGYFKLYFDIFKKIVPDELNFNQQGSEFEIQYLKEFGINFLLLVRNRIKLQEIPLFKNNILITENRIIFTNNFDLLTELNSYFNLRNRIQTKYLKFSDTKNWSYSFSQEIIYRKNDFGINLFLKIFEISSTENPLFQYEYDIPGKFSIKPEYYSGYRWYLLLNYRIPEILLISTKYSESVYPELNSVGSGGDKKEGNSIKTFSLQVDLVL